jgi:hypothetical protein
MYLDRIQRNEELTVGDHVHRPAVRGGYQPCSYHRKKDYMAVQKVEDVDQGQAGWPYQPNLPYGQTIIINVVHPSALLGPIDITHLQWERSNIFRGLW